MWAGIREESGENIIPTSQGAIKCRAVKRRGTEGERWNCEEFQNLEGTPWEPVPGRPGIDVKASMSEKIEDGME